MRQRVGFTTPGRVGVLIDGQFGSTGKGLIAAFIGRNDRVDFATTNASANAGHTAQIGGQKFVAYHLPMTAALNKVPAILNAGSIIDPDVLEHELDAFDFPRDLLLIHPRAAVIDGIDLNEENKAASAATLIASTRHGVGHALQRKIGRGATLAGQHPRLKQYVSKRDLPEIVEQWLNSGRYGVVEVPQGFGLGINSGYSYPFCTSREISVMQALADAQIHPMYLGEVMMTLRTFPIRVGNIVENGRTLGESGPFYPDSEELTWEDLGVTPEITTVTKRVRRVATFSRMQLKQASQSIKPEWVFLNFVNYIKQPHEFRMLVNIINDVCKHPVIYFGIGPDPTTDVTAMMDDVYARMGWEESDVLRG